MDASGSVQQRASIPHNPKGRAVSAHEPVSREFGRLTAFGSLVASPRDTQPETQNPHDVEFVAKVVRKYTKGLLGRASIALRSRRVKARLHSQTHPECRSFPTNLMWLACCDALSRTPGTNW